MATGTGANDGRLEYEEIPVVLSEAVIGALNTSSSSSFSSLSSLPSSSNSLSASPSSFSSSSSSSAQIGEGNPFLPTRLCIQSTNPFLSNQIPSTTVAYRTRGTGDGLTNPKPPSSPNQAFKPVSECLSITKRSNTPFQPSKPALETSGNRTPSSQWEIPGHSNEVDKSCLDPRNDGGRNMNTMNSIPSLHFKPAQETSGNRMLSSTWEIVGQSNEVDKSCLDPRNDGGGNINGPGAINSPFGTPVNPFATSTSTIQQTNQQRLPNLQASTDLTTNNEGARNTPFGTPLNRFTTSTSGTEPLTPPLRTSNLPTKPTDLTINNEGAMNTPYSTPVSRFSATPQIQQRSDFSTPNNTSARNTCSTPVCQFSATPQFQQRLDISTTNNTSARNASYNTPVNEFSTSPIPQRLEASTINHASARNTPFSTPASQFSAVPRIDMQRSPALPSTSSTSAIPQRLEASTINHASATNTPFSKPASQFSAVPRIDMQRSPALPSTSSTSATTTTTTTSSDHAAAVLSHSLKDQNKSAPQGSCSVACSNNFSKVSRELNEAKDQLFALSIQMAEQSGHINKLMEENRRYIKENGKLKKKTNSRNANNPTVLTQNNFDHFGAADVPAAYVGTDEVLTELQDRVMALQIHNDELNVCLEREKRRRRDAEARNERDEGYIKRLEDSVQALRGTRVVMDSNAYRQLAEAYIASRRPAARRSHPHVHSSGSDLVCDSSNTSLGLPSIPLQTSSCPSSPKSDFAHSSNTSSHMYIDDPQLYPAPPRRHGSIRGPKERNGERGNRALTSGTMSQWEYQQLLENLENLDGTNRGALS